jgi:hypothetical protein
MLAALLLAWTQASGPCPVCTTTGKDVRLCAPHADEERAVFARAGKRLSSKDAAERVAALEEFAALTRAHVNAPSARVADRIVGALDDESFDVRKRAAELLGPPQNALVAVAGLLEAFQATEAERERQQKGLDKIRAKQVGPPRPRENQLADLKHDEELATRTMESLLEWRAALLAQLARFPDDRVVTAILKAPRGLALGGNEALVQLGSKSALQGVAASFKVWEEELAHAQDLLTAAESIVVDEKMSKSLADALLEFFRKDVEKKKAEGAAHQPEIASLLVARELGPAPEASDKPHAAWESWLAAHLAALPEHLPGVSSPVR